MCEGDGYAHPVPGVFLIVGGFIPVCHEKEGLHEGDTVELVVEVVEDLRS